MLKNQDMDLSTNKIWTGSVDVNCVENNNIRSVKKGRRRHKKGKVKIENTMEIENLIQRSDDENCDNSVNYKSIDSFNTSQLENDKQSFSGLKAQTSGTNVLNLFTDKKISDCKKNNKSWLDTYDTLNADNEVFVFEDETEIGNTKAPSHNKSKKKKTTNKSWLDYDSSEDDDDSNDDISCNDTNPDLNKLNNHTSEQNNNLNAYKKRFVFKNTSDTTAENDACSIPDLPQVWNNEKQINIDQNPNVGINVNDWNRSGPAKKRDKFDGTKRSRRKTEPFDLSYQADGEMKDIFKTLNKITERKSSNSLSWDIPGGLCNFMADGNDNTANDLDGRNLLSGSISGKGLFIPFKNINGQLSRENSLERIFDESYVDDLDDLMNDGCIGSSDEKSESDEEDDRGCESVFGALPPEPQLGNVEYKLKLVNPTKQRFEHLVTQMKWRLREGQGEALYEIGVRDCGRVRGLSPSEMKASLLTLRHMATKLGAACTLLGHRRLADTRRALAEVLVRKIPDDQHNIEVRVAVMGSNDAGKSTLVGVLTQGELDNGRGSARLNMFRHLHEVKTGRTSSVSHEILGFDPQGRPINYASSELMTSEEINERSSKLVSFIDLAGHRKYLKTTVQGLTGYSPDYVMLVVSATAGINQMTLEHLALLILLDLPFFVVVTKIDVTSFFQIVKQLEDELKAIGCRKVPLSVLTMDDAVTAGSNAPFRCGIPILPVSSLTGKGLDVLRWFLFILPPVATPNRYEQEPIEFQVDETFKIGDVNGPVVGGLLKKGVLTEKTKLLIGPLDTGDFVPIHVNSLHRNKVPCRVVRAGQAASLGLSRLPPGLRQGMFLLAIPEDYVLQNDGYYDILKNTNQINMKDKNLYLRHGNNIIPVSNKISPKFRKKIKQRHSENRMLLKEIDNGVDSRDIIDKNDRIATSSIDIDNIVNEIANKDVKNININVKDDDKENARDVFRLSPSQYTSRFTNVFSSNAENSISELIVESAGDTNSSEDDLPAVDNKCICNEDLKKCDVDALNIVLEENPNDPRGCYFFQASVSLLNHSAPVYPGSQATVHIGNIRQTAVVEGILSSDKALRANEQAPVLFRFMRHPEFVRTGARILFREALHTKGVGRVTQVFPHKIFTNTSNCIKHSNVQDN